MSTGNNLQHPTSHQATRMVNPRVRITRRLTFWITSSGTTSRTSSFTQGGKADGQATVDEDLLPDLRAIPGSAPQGGHGKLPVRKGPMDQGRDRAERTGADKSHSGEEVRG